MPNADFRNDPDFQTFFSKVSPNKPLPVADINWQKILETLFAIFEVLKTKGWLSRWFTTMAVKGAMNRSSNAARQVALDDIRDRLR